MPIGLQKRIETVEQSQLEPFAQYYLMREDKTDILLTSAVSVGDSVINVSTGHGIQIGNYVSLFENSGYQQCVVLDVQTNAITLCVPIPIPFSTAAKVVRGSINLAVNGSTTPQEFIFKIYGGLIPIDLAGAVITMLHAGVPDDGKFGDQEALTTGLYLEYRNTSHRTLGNYRINSDFRDFGGLVSYPDKSPSGQYSTVITFDFIDTFTKELRVDPSVNDYIVATIRNDLTGLDSLRISILGSYTSGE